MSDPQYKNLVERINQSGFPLQLALEHQVKTSCKGWRVGTHEHHWRNNRTGDEGWIDLILEKGNAVIVVECKRALGGKWAFLVEKTRKQEKANCRVLQNRFIVHQSSGNTRSHTEVADIDLEPYTYQAEYCINVGDKASNGRELLENTAAATLSATEAIARSLESSVNPQRHTKHYIAAIVTTAELFAAFVDSSKTLLADGSIPDADIEPVRFIRFTKQLWSGENYPTPSHDRSVLGEVGRAKQHSVIVINAQHLVTFLKAFAPNNEDWSDW
jgi:Holliday junction resolvase-like predicted endonuclease